MAEFLIGFYVFGVCTWTLLGYISYVEAAFDGR